MIENINSVRFVEEAQRKFAKEWPGTNQRLADDDDTPMFNAEDMDACFRDGFMAGINWWKPILVYDYVGEKSELQIAVGNILNQKSEI